MTKRQRSFREHIYINFLVLNTFVIAAVALLVVATHKFSEDRVLRIQLETLIERADSDDDGVFLGSLTDMPARYQNQLQGLEPGFHELELTGSEVQTLVTDESGNRRFAMIVLNRDSSSVLFLLCLGLGSIIAFLLIYRFSGRLAARFSRPIEAMVHELSDSEENNEELSYPQVKEFDALNDQLQSFRREQSRRLVREANFARSVSHELRNPLTVIEGALELLKTQNDPDRQPDRLRRIDRALSNMRMTTETLLAFNRAEQNLVATHREFLDAFDDMLETSKLQMHEAVSLKVEYEGHPASAANWAPLIIVLQTLLSNSVRHTTHGEISITVSPVKASVIDTGEGIATETIRQIKENQALPGQLGFALVRRICDLSQWELKIDSDQNGTAVVIEFSVQQATMTQSI